MTVIPLTLHQTKFKLYCWLQAAFAHGDDGVGSTGVEPPQADERRW